MSTHKSALAAALAVAFGAVAAQAEAPKLGKPITEADIAAWDVAVMPDGTGLPPGSGTAAQGAVVYAQSGIGGDVEPDRVEAARFCVPLAAAKPVLI